VNNFPMSRERPHLVVLAGPNGAGKSTAAPELLKGALGVHEFVNADLIAQGLSGFQPENTAIEAGRILLHRLRRLTEQRVSVAFESTLASRSLAPWIRNLLGSGYAFHLLFLWLPTAEMAVARVQDRVRMGGHSVPEETIRRRYHAGLKNFFCLYRPLATTWRFYDNSAWPRPRLMASGAGNTTETVLDSAAWHTIEAGWRNA
jgi:predicted ABC-type ATPase